MVHASFIPPGFIIRVSKKRISSTLETFRLYLYYERIQSNKVEESGLNIFTDFSYILFLILLSFIYAFKNSFSYIFSFENNRNFKSFAIDSIVSPL